ncbi:MAG: class I SAM-dependent methyltransferase [Parachlamydiaceae bacterium]|nr:class I SAM-dependent methyltransferase [Parachlamydiaceae bacterium]
MIYQTINGKNIISILFIVYIHCISPNVHAIDETISNIEYWDNFIEKLYQQTEERALKPFSAVEILVRDFLWQIESDNPVLDIGCETGKNAICLIESGHNVVLLDVAPKAIHYTLENLRELNLEGSVVGTYKGKIEEFDSEYGPFKAIVGTYVFSFIPPNVFEQVMKENIFDKMEIGGFFAGGFFGPEHTWANDPTLTIITKEKLEAFFVNRGFSICFIEESKDMVVTVAGNEILFHTIKIVAQRIS